MDDFESVEDKVDSLKLDLDELTEKLSGLVEDIQSSDDVPIDSVEVIDTSYPRFTVHFIDPSEGSLPCSEINSVQDAQSVFAQAAQSRDLLPSPKRPVLHGDFMILMCENPGTTPSEEEETPSQKCYYIGVCVERDRSTQVQSPSSPLLHEIVAPVHNYPTSTPRNERYFIAWNSCGGGASAGEGLTDTFDLVTDVALTKTQSSPTSDGCVEVRFHLTVNKEEFVFEEGLLKSKTTVSPIQTSETIHVNLCDPCTGDSSFTTWPSQFTYTVTVTQTQAQMQRAIDQLNIDPNSCVTENGGTFILPRGHSINAFGDPIPPAEQCFYYMHPTLSPVTSCDPLIQYKYVHIDGSAKTFEWAPQIGTTINTSGSFNDTWSGPSTTTVPYDMERAGDYYEIRSTGGLTYDTIHKISW